MINKLLFIVLLLGLSACSTTSAPSNSYIESLRTDGIYATNNNGENNYIRFYLNEDGSKYFKLNFLKKFSAEKFEATADVIPAFSADADTKILKYTLHESGLRIRSTTDMNRFQFIPD